MLELGKDWRFPIDDELSRVWLTPKGRWGLVVRCMPTKVKVDGAFEEELTPRLLIDDLDFLGTHWQDFDGLEIAQDGAWHGDGDPTATLRVEQMGGLREATVRITGIEGTHLHVEIDGECDVFIDDDHDKDVPFRFAGKLPFEGVRFRFRAEGLDSREPERKATELLANHLIIEGFEPPTLKSLTEPGLYEAFFAPRESDALQSGEQPIDTSLSPEERVLHQSARELLTGMVKQEWIELEEGGIEALIPGFVDVLEMGGRGSRRAERISDWLMDQEHVIEVHVADEDLGPVLDKFW
ncbi:MAG: hypothetical protein AAF411_13185 [Myxococcota bacterium]